MSESREIIFISDLIKIYGEDLTNVDLSDYVIDMKYRNIENIILPRDKEFFQKIKDKSLYDVRMPKGDYSKYNFNGVDIHETRFSKNSKIPLDREFFRKLSRRSICGAKLPDGDYSIYNFEDVYMEDVNFTKNSIFSKDKDVFQKIRDKSLYSVKLPEGDYSEYNFEDVDMESVTFTKNSIVPRDKGFFQKLKDKNLCEVTMPKGDYSKYDFKDVNCSMTRFPFEALLPEDLNFLQLVSSNFYGDSKEHYTFGKKGFRLTRNVLKNIHRYNLNRINIDLRDYADYLTESQLSILRIKYRDELDKNIFLPERGYLEERNDSRTKDTNRELII